jgi:hypothetical protein
MIILLHSSNELPKTATRKGIQYGQDLRTYLMSIAHAVGDFSLLGEAEGRPRSFPNALKSMDSILSYPTRQDASPSRRISG